MLIFLGERTKELRKSVLADLKNPEQMRIVEAEAAKVSEPAWEYALRVLSRVENDDL